MRNIAAVLAAVPAAVVQVGSTMASTAGSVTARPVSQQQQQQQQRVGSSSRQEGTAAGEGSSSNSSSSSSRQEKQQQVEEAATAAAARSLQLQQCSRVKRSEPPGGIERLKLQLEV